MSPTPSLTKWKRKKFFTAADDRAEIAFPFRLIKLNCAGLQIGTAGDFADAVKSNRFVYIPATSEAFGNWRHAPEKKRRNRPYTEAPSEGRSLTLAVWRSQPA